MNLVHQRAPRAPFIYLSPGDLQRQRWLDHSPNVPGPAPPMPEMPPEVPSDLPPEIKDPPVPPEQPPIQEPPQTPGKIIAAGL